MARPTVTPTGREALAIDRLFSMIAASTTFQALTGAADAAEAEAFIFVSEVDEASVSALPAYALVAFGPISYPHDAMGSSHDHTTSGTLQFVLVADTPSGLEGEPGDYRADHGNATYWFSNAVSAILDELIALSGTAGMLAASGIQRPDNLKRQPRESRASNGDWWDVTYTVQFDDTAGVES